MIDRIAAAVEELAPGSRLAVAVSGGADSVFLLHALHSLGRVSLVLHVNHRLRGADSDGDEAFVRELAASLGLPAEVLSAVLPEGNTEQEARRVRYAFFTDQIAAGRCTHVATGHTMDDQAETVLDRFLRGAGTAGLSGIRPVTESGMVRPLLDLRRQEIRTWLRERGIRWREDASNNDLSYRRNRIRIDTLPSLAAAFNPSLSETLAATAEWARGEEEYWTAELARLEPEYLALKEQTVLIRLGLFSELPVAVARRLLRRAIGRVRGSLRSIEFRHVEAILGLTASRKGSGRIMLPGLDVYPSFDWLRLAPPGWDARHPREFEIPLIVPGTTRVEYPPLEIEAELNASPDVYTSGLVSGLDRDRCSGGLVLRNWRPGDRYECEAGSGVEKIKTLFQEFRVPLWERRSWPVITLGRGSDAPIVWSRRFGVARDFLARHFLERPGSERILEIREVVKAG